VHDVEVIPEDGVLAELLVDASVGVAEVAEGLLREHDAPAERLVGRVALEDRDVARRVGLLGQQSR
jgi:hypothetical protein